MAIETPRTPAPPALGPGADPWAALRRYTPARIAQGRTGVSLPTSAVLEFGQAQAAARDAVHAPFDADALLSRLRAAGLPALAVHSAAASRDQYLRRPDLGRRLDEASQIALAAARAPAPPDLVVVVADGLCAGAVAAHALPLLRHLLPLVPHLQLGPVVVAVQARVALGDEIAQLLRARAVAVCIGERPGLSATDSMGIYVTWAPCVGRTDAQRNCLSNVRPQGLDCAAAARDLAALLQAAAAAGFSGVQLKVDRPATQIE